MQLQSIGNNDYNPAFNASVRIDGNIKDIPQSLLSAWCEKAKNIGSDSDAIIIHFGKKENKKVKRFIFGLIPISDVYKSRSIYAIANIKGEHIDKLLGYINKRKNFDEDKFVEKSVNDYLSSLSKMQVWTVWQTQKYYLEWSGLRLLHFYYLYDNF